MIKIFTLGLIMGAVIGVLFGVLVMSVLMAGRAENIAEISDSALNSCENNLDG